MPEARPEPPPFRVLLVEDNPAHAHLVLRGLAGHPEVGEVEHVADGEAALDAVFQRGAFAGAARPHLVLLDLRLPRLGGLDVLRRIKASEAHRDIPIVVLTTSEAEREVSAAYDNYVNSYLVKPLDYDAFETLLGNLCAYWFDRHHRLGSGPPETTP